MTFLHTSDEQAGGRHADAPDARMEAQRKDCAKSLDDATAYVRPAAVAGSFYTADPTGLRRWVDDALAQARAQVAHLTDAGIIPQGAPKAVIVPHAGHRYSGHTAALAFALLERGRGRIRRVVIAGPTHRVAVRGVACCNASALRTPLGMLMVDRDAERTALESVPCLIVNDATHAKEHAVEVQLPFIQRALGDDVRIVQLNVGDCCPQQAGEALRAVWGGSETAVVISSDLSHYHPQEYARKLDDDTIADIVGHAAVLRPGQACGAFPINGLLDVCDGLGVRPVLLGRCTSGDDGGVPALADEPRPPMRNPDEAVVGYASFGVWTDRLPGADIPAGLPRQAGPILLRIARRSLEEALGIEPADAPKDEGADSEDISSAEWLRAPGASFVTLTEDGRLRGCIGTLTAHQPLAHDVAEHAVDAAFHDPRFPAVRPWEYPLLDVEVSVLGPPHTIASTSRKAVEDALTPGLDGLILGDATHRATYLPQVWDQLPDPHDFVDQLLAKAGLPQDYWSADMIAQTYRVSSFHDGGSRDNDNDGPSDSGTGGNGRGRHDCSGGRDERN